MPDDKHGLTAWEALRKLYGNELPPLTWVDRQYDYSLWRPFTEALQEGSWRAEGFVEPITPKSKPKPIPSNLWRFLNIDPYRDAAEGSGFEYIEVRYFDSEHAGDTKGPRLRPIPKSKLRAFMRQRIDALLEAGEQSSTRQDEAAAREHFGGNYTINRDWISELRDELGVPAEWSRRGRRLRILTGD